MVDIIRRGVFTKEDLKNIPPERRGEFYLSVFEAAAQELKDEGSISDFFRCNIETKEDPDFALVNNRRRVFNFKVTKNPGTAVSFNYRFPNIMAVGIMDIEDPSKTKPTEVIKRDILVRIQAKY